MINIEPDCIGKKNRKLGGKIWVAKSILHVKKWFIFQLQNNLGNFYMPQKISLKTSISINFEFFSKKIFSPCLLFHNILTNFVHLRQKLHKRWFYPCYFDGIFRLFFSVALRLTPLCHFFWEFNCWRFYF